MIYGRSGKLKESEYGTFSHAVSETGFKLVHSKVGYGDAIYSGPYRDRGVHVVTTDLNDAVVSMAQHAIGADLGGNYTYFSEDFDGSSSYSSEWKRIYNLSNHDWALLAADNSWGMHTDRYYSSGSISTASFGSCPTSISGRTKFVTYTDDNRVFMLDGMLLFIAAGKLAGVGKNTNNVLGDMIPDGAEFSSYFNTLAVYSGIALYDLGLDVTTWYASKTYFVCLNDSGLFAFGQIPDDFLSIGISVNNIDISEGKSFVDISAYNKTLIATDANDRIWVKGVLGEDFYSSWHDLGVWLYGAAGDGFCFLVDNLFNVYILGDGTSSMFLSESAEFDPPSAVVTEPHLYYSFEVVL